VINKIKNKNLILSFLGTDGAGKSSQIELLLKSDFIKIYSKIYHYHFFKKFKYTKKKVLPYNKSYGYFFSILKIIYIYFKFLIFYINISIFRFKKKKLIIIDRSYHDFIIDPERYGVIHFKFLIKFLFNFLPNPDIIFLFSAPSKIIMKRSNELEKKILRENLKKYKKFAKKFKNTIVIDTSKTKIKIHKYLLKKIKSYISFQN